MEIGTDILQGFDVVAYVDMIRDEVKNHHGGAVCMWGLDVATEHFIGKHIIAEADKRRA